MKVTDLQAPPTAAGGGGVRNTWVLPEHKIVFTSIGKNACTSIKWMLAEISGQDTARLTSTQSMAPSRRLAVHNRRFWQGVPRLSDLDDDHLAQISPAEGWFVFAVVRDPRLRLFSAWQSKFLVGDPLYSHRRYADRPWLPRTPENVDDVLVDWRQFVDGLALGRGHSFPVGDGHFAPQVDRLHETEVPYSRVYEMSEIGELPGDLERHLVATTGSAPSLVLGRENDTPLSAGAEVFPDDIRDTIEKIYAADLARFGHLWSLDKTLAKPVAWSKDAFQGLAARRAANERLADLYAEQRRLDDENRRLRAAADGSGASAAGNRPVVRRALAKARRIASSRLSGSSRR